MLCEFRLPRISPHMTGALIECLHAAPGTRLQAGDRLLDISVDLGAAFSQDCPPISYYRVVMREALWLRSLAASCGETWDTQRPIAILSTEPDEPVAGGAARAARAATAGILHHARMWSGGGG